MVSKKRILVAPLNWGLGHATRCIPIITNLIDCGFEPIIASDGAALDLLKKEFPSLLCIELPSYKISYSKKAKNFKLKILKDSPTIIKAIKKEKKLVKQLVIEHDIAGIISDNRFGVRYKQVPSVFITHQLHVLSGNTSWLSSKLHQRFISKFDECWVPDNRGLANLSGKLGHIDDTQLKLKYIGPLSRFKKETLDIEYDLMVLLSGPEPQRRYLEELLLEELKPFNGSILFVKGIVEAEQKHDKKDQFIIYNYMTSSQLEKAINRSRFIISRSGYTTIMDLAKLDKKAFFIPTPGQYEQEYLAERLNDANVIPYSNQDHFKLELLDKLNTYSGFKNQDYIVNFKKLFSLFERK